MSARSFKNQSFKFPVRAAHVVISAYIRRKEKRKPVTQAFSCLKDCTYKEGSKNMTQDKGVKLSTAQDQQCG